MPLSKLIFCLSFFSIVSLGAPPTAEDYKRFNEAAAQEDAHSSFGTVRRFALEFAKAKEAPQKFIPQLANWFDKAWQKTPTNRYTQLKDLEEFFHELPTDYQTVLSAESRKVLKKRTAGLVQTTDLCQTVCGLVKKSAEWHNETLFNAASRTRDSDSWHYAVRSLGALFMERARPYCQGLKESIPTQKQFRGSLDLDAFEKRKKEREDREKAEFLATIGALNAVEYSDKDTRNALKIFSEKIQNSSSLKDGSSLYGYQFYGLFLRDLQKKAKSTDLDLQEDLKQLDKKHFEAIMKSRTRDGDVEKRDPTKDQSVEEMGNSFFNWYAAATAMLSVPDQEEKLLKVLRKKLEELEPNVLDVPYLFTGKNEMSKGLRHGAARAVPVHLAFYMKASLPSEKRRYEKNLKAAIDNYITHLPALMAHAPRNGTHLGKDGLAPYYFYPTVPYVASSLKLLILREGDPKERERLEGLQSELTGALLTMLEKEGLFKPQGENIERMIVPDGPIGVITNRGGDGRLPAGFYNHDRNSPSYVNPLAGLALLAMIDKCGDQSLRSNFGIIDLDLEARLLISGPDNLVPTH